jgi:hypothetical protein
MAKMDVRWLYRIWSVVLTIILGSVQKPPRTWKHNDKILVSSLGSSDENRSRTFFVQNTFQRKVAWHVTILEAHIKKP